MKAELIDKAATDSCVIDNGIINPQIVPYYEQGFKDGIRWLKRNIWHNASETPIPGKKALVKYITGDLIIKYRVDVFCGYEWKEMCHYDKLLQFAYIEDLMPDMEDQL